MPTARTARQGGGEQWPGKGGPTEEESGAPGTAREGMADRGSSSASARCEDASEGERAGKHRRRQSDDEARAEERSASDARRARELQRNLENAAAAQAMSYAQGTGGFGSEAALSMAAQTFVLEVQRAQAQANELGIVARAEDGRALLELSPAELQRWVQENLDEAGMHD